jgi:ATP-dependent DNA helicase RecG
MVARALTAHPACPDTGPVFLREMNQPLSVLKGAGPRVGAALAQLGVLCLRDLLLLAPRDYEDRTRRVPLKDFARFPKVNTLARVIGHQWFGYGRMRTLKVIVDDGSAEAALVCFNRPFLEKQLPVGARIALCGSFQFRYGEIQSSTFEAEPLAEGEDLPPGRVLPVYPLSAGLTQGTMRKLATRAVEGYGKRAEPDLPTEIMERRGLLPTGRAIEELHTPSSMEALSDARRSLAYAELFYLELMIGRRSMARKAFRVERGQRAPGARRSGLARRLVERLPFTLTGDQERAFQEIRRDMDAPRPMARLLQGDVGSGKTLVSFLAACEAVERGSQAALMAPTELLARQHAETAARLLEPLGIRLAFLSGNVKEAGRRALLAALADGEIDLVIGTHALFSDDVRFRNLGLAIIDEQHRFGVLQRVALGAKAREPDVLLMTATPIPRTLALTEYGDLDVSALREMPAGRRPVITHLAVQGREQKVYDFVKREIDQGRRAYFVYPLIESSANLDLKDAVSMRESLASGPFKGLRVGLIHSRLPEEEKRETMAAFKRGDLQVLVATSVVEVGVDVPEATCMVVEHAERFGLAALHQLRGRVGRGSLQSYAFLVYSKELTEDARARLKVMMETTDGFKIAEEDLRIRGPGEISGTDQSGQLRLAFADLVRDAALLEDARSDAFALLEADPGLSSPANAVVREVLRRAPPFSESIAARG